LAATFIPTLRIGRFIIFAIALVFIRPDPVFALRESGFEITGAEFQLVAIPPGCFARTSA